MIRRIERLRNFGIFHRFVGDEASGVPEFKRFNLIYGWNYSGKTTLSRVFRALEQNKLDHHYSSATFGLTLEDGSSIDSADLSQTPVVRVFNRDFVDSNFQTEHAAPAVFILGEQNAALKDRLAQLKGRTERVERIALEASSEKSKIESDSLTLKTNRAREIGNLLGVRDFRRPNLDKRVAEVRGDTGGHLLTDEAVQSHHATLRSGQDYSELGKIDSAVPDLSVAAADVNQLLAQTASRRAIDELASEPNLEKWVRQGRKLHENRTECGFCGGVLRDERLNKLKEHFSLAYEGLLDDIHRKFNEITQLDLVLDLPDEMRLQPEVRPEFTKSKQEVKKWFRWAEGIRQSLLKALGAKQLNIERITLWEEDLTKVAEMKAHLEGLQAIVKRHNEIVGSIDKAKSDAREALERHYSAVFFEENKIANRERKCADFQKREGRANGLKQLIENQKAGIEARISASSIGAERLNGLLKYLLVGCNIEVEKVGDSEFQFLRDGQIAINLSDGEKTAVTFSYFLTGLEAEGSSPGDTIVFVDDPISSLDSNHVYAVFALICERLGCCKQLFVSTHNSEFFNLLKCQWLGPMGGNKPDSSAYRIFREVQPDGSSPAWIANLPLLLRRYKSEYEFVFSHLHRFVENSAPSEHEAFAAPALLRKFLEAYLGFRKPGIRKWHEKLDLLFDTAEQRHEIHRFADDASHLQSLDRSLQHPDFVSSSRRCVKSVLDALKENDPDHYDSLVGIVAEVRNA